MKLFNVQLLSSLTSQFQSTFKTLHFYIRLDFLQVALLRWREAKYIAFAIFLSLDNNLLKDLPRRFLFCYENNQF